MTMTKKYICRLSNELFDKKQNILLFFVIICSLFLFLGTKLLWTQEWRWIDIPLAMMYRHDFLHPFLGGNAYYDKPLLSYWFIIPFLKLLPHSPITAIRIPSAIAAAIVIFSTYRLSKLLFNRQTAIMTAWMFVSTYFFIFWARTSSADMLNLAGIMVALLYYFKHRDSAFFKNYFFFFLILAFASLLKGPVAAAIVILVLIPEIFLNQQWKKHVNFQCFFALILGIIIYITPFFLSSHFNQTQYQESGLTLVFQENILRFFKPFDHQGPIYTYFIYLPMYTFPWILFFIPGIADLLKKYQKIDCHTRWIIYANILIFLFLTISGSRRSYYIIPMIPFVLMLTARWINILQNKKIEKIAAFIAIFFSAAIIFINVIIVPISLMGGGASIFANDIKKIALQQNPPWSSWKLVITGTDIVEAYYINTKQPIQYVSTDDLKNLLKEKKQQTIFLFENLAILNTIDAATLINYTIVNEKPVLYQRLWHEKTDQAVALITK